MRYLQSIVSATVFVILCALVDLYLVTLGDHWATSMDDLHYLFWPKFFYGLLVGWIAGRIVRSTRLPLFGFFVFVGLLAYYRWNFAVVHIYFIDDPEFYFLFVGPYVAFFFALVSLMLWVGRRNGPDPGDGLASEGPMRYPCPVCGAPAASRWRVLSTGPLKSFPCGRCGARLGVSRGIAFLTIALGAVLYPAGVLAVFWLGEKFGSGALISAAVIPAALCLGGPLACLPALWLQLRWARLEVRQTAQVREA